ncbi:MAG TPA: hypothetical protein VGM37_05365 [Armatimonadota bacterium]|jgi:hypothetical protein
MGTAYTPGLKVSPYTAVRKTRRLPRKGDVLVKVGDVVTPDTVVARALLPGNMALVKVAGVLGVDPDEVEALLHYKIGDTVQRGDVLAQTKSFLGLFKSECKASTSGEIETFSSVTGNMGIREPAIPIDVMAYVEGTVVEVMPGDGCVVEARGAFVQGIFGVGGERQGTIVMAVGSPTETLSAAMIRPDMAGRIVVGGALVTGEALARAAEVGVAAVVAGGIVDTDVETYVGHSIGVAITGQEPVNTTLVITEGFGLITMAQRTFDLLKAHEGKQASVNGATQIRAGVIRPEVIVPLPAPAQAARDGAQDAHTLDIGTPIRIIREPYFGELAAVTALPPELTEIPSGAMVRVLEARLRNGSNVTVPRANVEIIEG